MCFHFHSLYKKVEVQFDSTLSFDQRVSHICKVSFQLQDLFKTHPFLSSSPTPLFFLPGHTTQQQALWLMYLSACIFTILLLSLKLPCTDVSSTKAWLQHKSFSEAKNHARANELWLLTRCLPFSAPFFSKLSSFILSPVVANGSYLNFLYSWHVFYSISMSAGKKKANQNNTTSEQTEEATEIRQRYYLRVIYWFIFL